MATFIAGMHGDNRKEVTRIGRTRLQVTLDGWEIGVWAKAHRGRDGDTPQIDLYMTGGSHARITPVLLGTIRLENTVPCFTPKTNTPKWQAQEDQ